MATGELRNFSSVPPTRAFRTCSTRCLAEIGELSLLRRPASWHREFHAKLSAFEIVIEPCDAVSVVINRLSLIKPASRSSWP
jgi:hypothetical protein